MSRTGRDDPAGGAGAGSPPKTRRSEPPVGGSSADVPRPLRISVIVPVYNTKRYLSACLDSLLAQTYPRDQMEIIVVDDGSTDGSGAIADGYAARFGSLRVIHQANAGSSAARNAGIGAARGDYLGFVDSDDTVDPGMYAALADLILRTGVRMAQTGRDERAEDGSPLPEVVKAPAEEGFIMAEEMLFSLLLHEGDASFCTKLVDKRLFVGEPGLAKVPPLCFPEGELNEDFWLLVRMLERIDRLGMLPRRDYHVRYRTGSNSRKERAQADYFPPVFTDIVRNSDRVMAQVREKHPGILPAARRFALAQRLDYLLHIPVSQMHRDNTFYREVVGYVRKNRRELILNPYLSQKERSYLWILSIAPRTVRSIHRRLRGL